jgi:hypothetical protein
MHRGSVFAAFGWLLGVALLAPSAARGQTTTTTTTTAGPVITASTNIFPDRILPDGTDLMESTRPEYLNPLGINYDDCAQDMRLQFTISISGFDGQALEVWASNVGDCTAPAARGAQGGIPSCWELYEQAGVISAATQPVTVTVNVRDIVGPQNGVPNPPSVSATQQRGEGLNLAACATQPSFTAVPMYIWFLAVDSAANSDGTPYEYGSTTTPFVTDLVGPPQPQEPTEQVGDTLFIVNWTANIDSDTAGYDVFIDPIPGHEDAGSAGVQTILYCLDATAGSSSSSSSGSSSSSSSSGSSDDASDESDSSDVLDSTASSSSSSSSGSSSSSSSSGSSSGASCFYINTAGPTAGVGGTCSDSILSSGTVIDSGTAGTVSTPIYDDAGNLIDASVMNTGGGLSQIPLTHLVGASDNTFTVSGVSVGTYTITGLLNGTVYYVAVAAVDGSGNIGPPSKEVCDYPAPVNDFWTLYRNAGGGAGGGFCALEAVGEPVPSTAGIAMLVGATAIGLQRRRRRRRARGGERAGMES